MSRAAFEVWFTHDWLPARRTELAYAAWIAATERAAKIVRTVDLSQIAGTDFLQYTAMLCTALEDAIRGDQP